MRVDYLRYANGRTGNTDKLALEHVGLEADSRGQLQVNGNYQNNGKYIYAVGDMINYPSLACEADDQGRSQFKDLARAQIAGTEVGA